MTPMPISPFLTDPDQTDCIGEIFIGAQKLESRFVLNEIEFMEALEEPPLFLRKTANGGM